MTIFNKQANKNDNLQCIHRLQKLYTKVVTIVKAAINILQKISHTHAYICYINPCQIYINNKAK